MNKPNSLPCPKAERLIIALTCLGLLCLNSIASISRCAGQIQTPSDGSGGNSANENRTATPATGLSLETAVRQSRPGVVKIYGAGGYQSLEAYQSGFFISEDGLILTAWSYVLDPEAIRIVDHHGKRTQATLLGYDPETEIAILETKLRPAHWFPLKQATRSSVGTRVLAISNLFNVAIGNEPVSVQTGIISAVGSLDAAQRALKVSYHGPVYFLDAVTNNPGSSGGALLDQHGALLGMLGKELQNAEGGFWINYAIPLDVLAERVQRIQDRQDGIAETDSSDQPLESADLQAVGVTLIPRLTLNTPAYIEWVEQESPGWTSGLRPDDLILKVQGNLTTTRDQVVAAIKKIDRFAPLQFTIRRDQELLILTITP